MKTEESSKIVYDANNNIIAIISSQQIETQKRKINWKYIMNEYIIPSVIMIVAEGLFIAYCFHRLGCF